MWYISSWGLLVRIWEHLYYYSSPPHPPPALINALPISTHTIADLKLTLTLVPLGNLPNLNSCAASYCFPTLKLWLRHKPPSYITSIRSIRGSIRLFILALRLLDGCIFVVIRLDRRSYCCIEERLAKVESKDGMGHYLWCRYDHSKKRHKLLKIDYNYLSFLFRFLWTMEDR